MKMTPSTHIVISTHLNRTMWWNLRVSLLDDVSPVYDYFEDHKFLYDLVKHAILYNIQDQCQHLNNTDSPKNHSETQS